MAVEETTTLKECSRCSQSKPHEAFNRGSRFSDGLQPYCRDCNREYHAARYEVDGERLKAYGRKWHRENRERVAEAARRYRVTITREATLRTVLLCKARTGNAARRVVDKIRSGKMTPGPCEVCGSIESINGHHDDYRKPFEVRWLCQAHHSEWHRFNSPIYLDNWESRFESLARERGLAL